MIDERYVLEQRLGLGGMGEVWRARREQDFFAIKFILPDLRQHRGIVDRFKREIETANRLTSKHTLRCYEWGFDPVHGYYLVMELLSGQTLREVIARGRLAPETAVDYIIQATEAIHEAHLHGIIHRDLKPENLFLARTAREDQIKVLDFGIAKLTRDADVRKLTDAGSFVGTKNYSSPEQFHSSDQATAASDIWSLGAILYELLCGSKAFPGDDMKAVARILTTAPAPLAALQSDLPPRLIAIVDKCLERDPTLRFTSATEFQSALRRFGTNAIDTAFGEATTHVHGILPPPDAVDVRRVIAIGPSPNEELPPRSRYSLQPPSRKFSEAGALIEAICTGEKRDGNPRRVVFMLGAGFSLPAIPKTHDFVDLIREKLPRSERATIDVMKRNSANLYQEAFRLLRGHSSSYRANEVVRTAVLNAYESQVNLEANEDAQARQCRMLEKQIARWALPDGVQHLAAIVRAGLWRATSQELAEGKLDARFSNIHLTTNFDPLLTIAIRRLGGVVNPVSVIRDMALPTPSEQSCTLVHLHGRWEEGDTLHVDLDILRPTLQESLFELLNESTLVVVGYAGWDDVFVRALTQPTHAHKDFDVRWTFYEIDAAKIEAQSGALIGKLTDALGPHITFYRGIDTNSLFRDLRARLLPEHSSQQSSSSSDARISNITPLPAEPMNSSYHPRHSRPLSIAVAPLLSVGLVALAAALVWRFAGSGTHGTHQLSPAASSSSAAPPPASTARPPDESITVDLSFKGRLCPSEIRVRVSPKSNWIDAAAPTRVCNSSIELPAKLEGELQARLVFRNGTCISKAQLQGKRLAVAGCLPSISCAYTAQAKDPYELRLLRDRRCTHL
ncbi:MAG: protein kinase, partial [Polyangiaceae bacterium]